LKVEERSQNAGGEELIQWRGRRQRAPRSCRGAPFQLSPLPAELEGELELARVVRGGWLAGGTGQAGQGIAKLVDGGNVGTVKEVEGIGDEVDLEALAEGDAP